MMNTPKMPIISNQRASSLPQMGFPLIAKDYDFQSTPKLLINKY
jgi:hypothetical protein